MQWVSIVSGGLGLSPSQLGLGVHSFRLLGQALVILLLIFPEERDGILARSHRFPVPHLSPCLLLPLKHVGYKR